MEPFDGTEAQESCVRDLPIRQHDAAIAPAWRELASLLIEIGGENRKIGAKIDFAYVR
jgi:hypothetical protein